MARQDRTAYGSSRAKRLTRHHLFWREPPSLIHHRRGACRGTPPRPAIPRTAPPLRVVTAPHPRRSHSATGIGGRSPRRNRLPPARSRFSTWHWGESGVDGWEVSRREIDEVHDVDVEVDQDPVDSVFE